MFFFPALGQRPTDSSTHSDSGSFHISRGPLGVPSSWSEPMGRGVHPHHNQHHLHNQLPPNLDSYRENTPGAEFQPPHSRDLKLPSSKPTTDKKKTLRDVVPPLCASRLKPIRQKTKNAVVRFCTLFYLFFLEQLKYLYLCISVSQVSILDSGEVCMELLKSQTGQERVKEVLQISCDGSMVLLHSEKRAGR